jgi:16S rRNA (cytidine1402-2'-O)-methyltransferase
MKFMSDKTSPGTLYLIPTPIGDDGLHTLPAHVVEVIHRLRYYIAENARTARRFIKTTQPAYTIEMLQIAELDKHNINDPADFLQPTLKGHDLGLMSEAGCPGVADPGSVLVAYAHQKGVPVVPLTGPSSIILALMGSGMSGQKFTFHGYLPAKRPQLIKTLGQLENVSLKQRSTEIFIEAPYRNGQVIECAMSVLRSATRFCIACHLTMPDMYLRTATIGTWQKTKIPDIHKKPAVFLIEAY